MFERSAYVLARRSRRTGHRVARTQSADGDRREIRACCDCMFLFAHVRCLLKALSVMDSGSGQLYQEDDWRYEARSLAVLFAVLFCLQTVVHCA
jgi:hypothetical protein